MNKKITGLLIALTLLVPSTVANAALKNKSSVPTVAILDTALDTSLPIFKDRIAYEVCILEYLSCPNGKSFQEGPGSSVMDPKFIKSNGFEHGTQISSLFVANNKTYNIVFIRIVPSGPTGLRKPLTYNAVDKALTWVYQNKDLYNIKMISMSQGDHSSLGAPKTDYCTKRNTTNILIDQLWQSGVVSFFPTGNNSDYQRIDWPACIPNSVSVGSVDKLNTIFITSNADINNPTLVDFYAQGHAVPLVNPGNIPSVGSGTSYATIVAAAQWATISDSKPGLSVSDLYTLIKNKSTQVKSARVPSGNMINVNGAING
jgi:hypothetical protein